MHRRQLRILPLLAMSLVLDPSTPDALITVGIHAPARPRSVAVVDDLAYVASDPSGLSVLDVSNPAAPIELGAIDTPGQANGVAVAGEMAYVADGYAGLRAIDVSNPAAPRELGAVGNPGYANDVAVVGGFAYVAAQLSGLRVIDVSNPAAPVEIGALDTPGQALRVAVVGGLAYLADGTSGLRVIDVSNPAAPIEIGALEDPQFALSVAVEGALAFVAGGSLGLSVVDVSNPASPAVIGTLEMPRTFSPIDVAVAVAGELVFVMDIWSRLISVDVSYPASPTLMGTLDRSTRWLFGDNPHSRVLAVSENFVYVAHPSGLVVVDASDPAALEPISISGPVGSVRDVEVADGLAYVANGTAGLQVLDISTPSAPVEIGAVDTPGFAVSVERVGALAYVCDDSGLRIIDVSNPAAPIEIGAIDTPGSAVAVAVRGGMAYLASSDAGLRLIDVSSPEAPVEVGALATPSTAGTFVAVEVVGEIAYVALAAVFPGRLGGVSPPSGLRVVDVSNPAAPVEIGVFETRGSARDVEVVDGLAYLEIATYTEVSFPRSLVIPSSLRILDVSSPETPIEIGALDSSAGDVEIVGETAYVADFFRGLQLIDVSDPANPASMGALDTPGYPGGVAVAGELAYFADGDSLRVIDLSNPARPAEMGALEPTYATDVTLGVAVVGELAYLAEGESGLRVVDVSDAAMPLELGALDTPGFAVDLALAGELAYVADSDSGMRIVDVSNPAAPVEVGAFDTPGQANDVAVANGLAYVADGAFGLRIVDVSTPGTPIEIGVLDTPGDARGIAVVEGLAYLADGASGLRVIDVFNPAAPVEIGSIDTPNSSPIYGIAVGALDVVVVDGLAYLANGTAGGLRIIDVSNPAAPFEVGAIQTSNRANGVAVIGDFAYVAEGDEYPSSRILSPGPPSLRAIDVSKPAKPVEIGAIFGGAYDVTVVGGLVYAAGGTSGLRIIDFGPEYAAPRQVAIDIRPGSEANRINPASRGVIPVAVLGSAIFDVADADLATLRFGPGDAAPSQRGRTRLADVNRDGFTDLVSHFWMQETGIAPGDTRACISGKTREGAEFRGCDAIRSRP